MRRPCCLGLKSAPPAVRSLDEVHASWLALAAAGSRDRSIKLWDVDVEPGAPPVCTTPLASKQLKRVRCNCDGASSACNMQMEVSLRLVTALSATLSILQHTTVEVTEKTHAFPDTSRHPKPGPCRCFAACALHRVKRGT